MEGRERLLRHLETGFTEPVRDPVWKHIYLPAPFARMIEREPFLKLSRIRQLGPAHLVYPGATHTRYAHSLGVFHLAGRTMVALLRAPGGEELGRIVTEEGLRSFLAAALLHDLGHFPFAHSLKELPLAGHEALTAELILEEPVRGLLADYGADSEMAAAIVDTSRPGGGEPQVDFFRHVLSGVLDPDKLDYLNRDAYFCGVPYGVQDVDFILSRIRPLTNGAQTGAGPLARGSAPSEGTPYRGVALDVRGIQAVESILFSKYLMYRAVYWHRTVRAATAMIKKAVSGALAAHAVTPGALYGLDDDGFVRLAAASTFPAFGLVGRVLERQLYTPLLELPWNAENPVHRELADLAARAGAEARAAEKLSRVSDGQLSPLDVIIDIPEPISFESDLPIAGEGRTFNESTTVFTRPVIAGFTAALRSVRLFCARPIDTTRIPSLEELVQ